MRLGMFMMADFVETVVIAGMTTALFLGGWQVPYLAAGGFHLPWGADLPLSHLTVVTLQVFVFWLKVAVMCWFLMLVRWTLPRFRYDQAMRLGRLGPFPLSAPGTGSPVPGPGEAAAVRAAAADPPSARQKGGRVAPLRGVHDVRDGLSGALHLHRGRRAPEPGDREGAGAVRHRPRQVRFLRVLRGGVPGGRHPHGHGHPRVFLLQPARDDLHEGDAPRPGAGRARRDAPVAHPHSRRPDAKPMSHPVCP